MNDTASELQQSARRPGDHHAGRFGWPAPTPTRTAMGEALARYSLWWEEVQRDLSSHFLHWRSPRFRYPLFPKPLSEAGALRYHATRFGRSWCKVGPTYRSYTRGEVKALKKDLKEAAESFKEGTKFFKTCSDEMRSEYEKLKMMVEEYATMVKAGLDGEAANMNISREHAAQLKHAVDELKEALKACNAGKNFKVTNYQKFFRIPGIKACKDLTSFVGIVTVLLIATGYIELSDPAPFDPKTTKAGKLLFDDFCSGLKVSCTSSFSPTAMITSLLSGELDALQSHIMISRIQEYWSCEIGFTPGHDFVAKARMKGIWANGLKINLNLPIYDGLQRRLEFNQKHCFGCIGGTLGLNANPILKLNALFGSQQLSGGFLADYELVPGILRRLAVGGALNIFGIYASVIMEKIFDPQAAGQQPPQPVVRHQVTSSVHLQATKSTFVAAELTHCMEQQETTLTVGVEHHVDSVTSFKGRLTNRGLLTGMIQHNIHDKAVLSLTAMVNLAAPNAVVPGIGFSVSIAP